VIIPNERVLNDPEPDEGNIHIEHDAFRVPGSRPEVVANRHQRRDDTVRLNSEYKPLYAN
jgi:hypothetical protein